MILSGKLSRTELYRGAKINQSATPERRLTASAVGANVPLLSGHDSRRKDIHMQISCKFSPAQDEGMNKGRNLPRRLVSALALAASFSNPSNGNMGNGNMVYKTVTTRSRPKQITPCEP